MIPAAMTADTASPSLRPIPADHRHALAPLIWRGTKAGAFITATWFLAIPQLPLAWEALSSLNDVPGWRIVLGALCATAALASYAQLTRTLLDDGHRPGLAHTFAIITTSFGVNRVVPGGAAAAGLLTFRLLQRSGVSKVRAMFTIATQNIGSALVLNLILWAALLAALPGSGFDTRYVTAIIGGAGLILAGGVGVEALLHQRCWVWALLTRIERGLPFLTGRLTAVVDETADQLSLLAARPRTLRRAMGWATANWALDIVALWLFLGAFGVHVSPVGVVIAFALANLAAVIPITPGGLGVVELVMAATLVGFGGAAAPVALGIAAFRVFNYWAAIPVSGISYAALRVFTVPRPPASPVPDNT